MKQHSLYITQLGAMLESITTMQQHSDIAGTEIEKALERARVELAIVRTFLKGENK